MSGRDGQGRGIRWTDWVRGALAVVVGYALYAVGLMGLVIFWFMRGDGVGGVAGHLGNVVALFLLGALVAEAVVRVAGRGARAAILIVLAVIVSVSALNLYLGVAIEPQWFTVLAVLLISVAMLLRRSATPRPSSSG